MYGVVVNVVNAGPEMPLRANCSVNAAVPDLAASQVIFPVPLEGRPAVKLSDLLAEFFDVWRFDERVVMIR